MAQPNIIFILVDDMGYGDFSAFNDGISSTPTLDALIGESVCLTQHYSASPVCNASRAALLTGRYPHRTGSIDTFDSRGLDRMALREVTMADVFKTAGYATGIIGKWHLGCHDMRYHPIRRGFDEFVGFSGGWWDYYNWPIDCNGNRYSTDGVYLTDLFTEEAVQFVERHQKKPFFLHLAYNAPHYPFQAPEQDMKPYAETGSFTKAVSTIYGMLQCVDRGVARLLETLKRLGIDDNTILIFTSDNGPEMAREGDWCTVRFNCGFAGSKGSVLEGGIRLPFILRWPAGIDGGQDFSEMVHMTDWLPTLCAMAGIDAPKDVNLDGANVLSVLRGEGGKLPEQRFWQWNRYTPMITTNAAMRDGEWKLVRPTINEANEVSIRDFYVFDHLWPSDDLCTDPVPLRDIPSPDPVELYNIHEDPLERRNLADKYPDRARRMLHELETWFEEVEAERSTIDDDWTVRRITPL